MPSLKEALKDILPKLTLKVKHKPHEKWAIDRPVEFHECYGCETMVDQRIIDCCILTATDDYAQWLVKKYDRWCKIHNTPAVMELCATSKPCKRCYRWSTSRAKGGVCWTCRHNPWSEMPVPTLAKRVWFVVPKEDSEVEDE